ncbi:UNVERIFIED_CONTAM: hypothetical protein FKN15_023567 [Acipenser sinensis]
MGTAGLFQLFETTRIRRETGDGLLRPARLFVMSLSVVPALLWLAALCSLLPPAVTAKRERCETCRLLTDSFNKVAETRLVEIVEGVCESSDFDCNQLLEQIEEHMETWWFKRQQEAPDLFQWLCIETIQVCCPPDTFGADCAACFHSCKRCTGPEDYKCEECKAGWILHDNKCVATPEKGLFEEITDDEVLVLQQMFFGVVICALATLAAKGDMVFTAIFIGGLAAMAGYWLSEKGDRLLEGFLKGR